MTINQDEDDIIYQVGADIVLTELANYTASRLVDTDELKRLIAKSRAKLNELVNVASRAEHGGVQ